MLRQGYKEKLIGVAEGVSYYRCDLSKPTEVEEVARRVQAEEGHP